MQRRLGKESSRHGRRRTDKLGIVVVGEIKGESQSSFAAWVFTGAHPLKVELPAAYTPELPEPMNLEGITRQPLWAFRRQIYEVSGAFGMSDEEIALRLKHHVFTGNRELQRM